MRILFKIALAILVAVHSTFTFAQQDPSLQTVMAEGVGTSIDSALQNAAQNALTNVVGSFIDANKILEKRVQIKEGIREQTTFIRNDIKEYSQGWIKNIQVLESSLESGLFRVTAKVTIKNEAFKLFAKKLAQSEAPVDQGLFSAMAVEVKQSRDLTKILDDIVVQLLLGEVYDFKILPLRSLRQIDDKDIGGEIINEMTDKFDHSNIFYFDVEMNVKNDYIKSVLSIFESTAKKKISLGSISQNTPSVYSNEMQGERDKLLESSSANSVIFLVHNMKINAYIFDIPRKKFAKNFAWAEFFAREWIDTIPYDYKDLIPKLQVRLLNENGNEIAAHLLNYPHSGIPAGDNNFGVAIAPRLDKSNEACRRYPCNQPLIGSIQTHKQSFPTIDLDNRKIRVFLAIGDKERASRKIVVEFVQ